MQVWTKVQAVVIRIFQTALHHRLVEGAQCLHWPNNTLLTCNTCSLVVILAHTQCFTHTTTIPTHNNIDRLSTRAFSTAVWALAMLPDPAKTLGTPAAQSARARTVAALGAYAIGTMNRMKAEEMFHLLAGLHLLGFKAPERLEPKPRVGRDGKLVVPAAGATRGAPKSLAGLVESRSIKVCRKYEKRVVRFWSGHWAAPGKQACVACLVGDRGIAIAALPLAPWHWGNLVLVRVASRTVSPPSASRQKKIES